MPYIEITQSEFENVFNKQGYKWKIVPDYMAKETIYLVESDGTYIKVFSSLVSGISREVGADAIRVVGWDPISNLPVMASEKRVYRTDGWRDNLVSRIEEAKLKMKGVEKCKICGGIMVERENKKTREKFMGCLNWKGHGKKESNIDGRVSVDIKQPHINIDGPVLDANAILSSFQDRMKGLAERLNIRYYEVKGDEPLMETKLFKWGSYPFEKFNVIQSNVAKYVEDNNNVVIEAKTSTGKTIMGELFMWKVLADGKKVIYTSPLKALTREKWDNWGKKFGEKGCKLAIVTGDYRLTDKRIRELNEANIILCTSEMLDHRTRNMTSEKSEWLVKAGLLIVDEVQLIGMPGRGDKLEAGLMRFTKINPVCRLVFLSGTMPNSGEISGWLKDLNGKDTVLIRSGWRPVKLNMVYEKYDDSGGYYAGKAELFRKVIDGVKRHEKDKILIFVHSKTDGRRIMGILTEEGYSAEFHNADLEVDDRVNIEESFKNRDSGVRIIIATSTLAYGLNLPARIVIITGMHRGLEEVSELDIIQMCGRSGRMGIDIEGDAIIILPETGFNEYKQRIENPGNIISQIDNPLVAGFHIIGEIVNRQIMTREDVYKWYARTLASRQNVAKVDIKYIDELVNYLIKNEAIRETDIEIIDDKGEKKTVKRLIETELGKACCYFYLRPDMLKDMMDNFDKLFNMKVETNDFLVTIALGKIKMFEEMIVSKDEKAYIEKYHGATKAIEATLGSCLEGQSKVGMAYLNMLKGVKGTEIDKDGNKKTNPLASLQRGLQQDVERISQVMAYLDAKYIKWGKGNYWNIMGLRMKYGVGPELVGLCSLEGVGGAFAKKLWDAGIRQPIELVSKKKEAIMALGARYNGIIRKNREIFELLGVKIEQNIEEKKIEEKKIEEKIETKEISTKSEFITFKGKTLRLIQDSEMMK